MHSSKRTFWTSLTLGALVALVSIPAHAGKKDKVYTGTLDDGRLEVSWFSPDGLNFREMDEADYFWVKPGFSAEGRTLHIHPWPEPRFIGEDADERDREDEDLAENMAERMDDIIADIWGDELEGYATVSLDSGDIDVQGRIVDASTGSVVASAIVGWGAGSGSATVDLKFLDAATGELLVAIHHRETMDASWWEEVDESDFGDWLEDLAKDIRKKGLDKLYEKGDAVDD